MDRRDLEELRQLEKLKKGPIPQHLAVIMDGNGRWAKAKGLARMAGHRAGVGVLDDLITTVKELGISYVTVYAFSTENWKRPKREVFGLMELLIEFLEKKTPKLMQEGVRLQAIGDIQALPEAVQASLARVDKITASNRELVFNLALNYGGRQEILHACQRLAMDVEEGRLKADDISEEHLRAYLYTAGQPDPDLLIRTSGEVRVSNFLLWQIAYSEIWITDTYWPDFRTKDLLAAVASYQSRDRRYGGLSKK